MEPKDSNPEEKPEFTAPVILEKPDASATKPAASSAPVPTPHPETVQVVAVSFLRAGKIYDFECRDLKLEAGDSVLVETDEGLGFATVVIPPRPEKSSELPHPLKKVIRKTSYDDMRQHQKNKEREERAYQVCNRKIREARLPMKLVQVEYLHGGSKAIFYFSSEERVDFRNLVRDLAHEFHTRIEMKQIGPRDEAKKMGGIGVCGRELCCSTWLRDFDPVSIKMAKEQELSLNPSKLAGQCGRLKCCLSYEFETYVEAKRGLPKISKKVCWKDGSSCGRVNGYNVFSGTMRVVTEDGSEQQVNPQDVMVVRHGKDPQPKDSPENSSS